MVDVTVRGAGIFGLSVAWSCVRRGARVQIVDPDGVGDGASGGVLGALAPHVPENWNEKKAFQLESLLLAEAFWAEVGAVSGQDPSYARDGRLQPIADERQLQQARDRANGAAQFWEDAAVWEVIPSGQSEWEPHSPSGYLVRDTLTARLHPRTAMQTLAQALATLGAPVMREAEDEGRVVHATGVADLAQLNAAFGKTVGAPIKGQAAVFQYDASGAAQIFVEARRRSQGVLGGIVDDLGVDVLVGAIHSQAGTVGCALEVTAQAPVALLGLFLAWSGHSGIAVG